MICEKCGQPTSGPYCGHCGHRAASPTQENAFNWPFQEREWFWSVLLSMAWIVPFGQFLSMGWALEAIRRRACHRPQKLPFPRDVDKMIVSGFILFLMICMYFLVPVTFLVWMSQFDWLPSLWQLMVLLWDMFWHKPHPGLWAFLVTKTIAILTYSLGPVIYLLVATPLFFAARLRYAATGQVRSFFRLFANIAFCFRNIPQLLTYCFLSSLLGVGLVLAQFLYFTLVSLIFPPLLLVPVVGQIVPAVLGAICTWMRVYWVTPLAEEMVINASYLEDASANLPAVS